MTAYTCYHCGKTMSLANPPGKERKCPYCGRKMHVCQNCQFFHVTGCCLGGEHPFEAAHGTLCMKFEFRALVA